MPLYEYVCSECEMYWEEMKKVKDRDNATPCPVCESDKVKRKVSSFGGYNIHGNNSASVRPRNAGYRKTKK